LGTRQEFRRNIFQFDDSTDHIGRRVVNGDRIGQFAGKVAGKIRQCGAFVVFLVGDNVGVCFGVGRGVIVIVIIAVVVLFRLVSYSLLSSSRSRSVAAPLLSDGDLSLL
jgi:hypothetical protein